MRSSPGHAKWLREKTGPLACVCCLGPQPGSEGETARGRPPRGLCDTQEGPWPRLTGTRILGLLAPSAGSVHAHTPGTRGSSLSECFRLLQTRETRWGWGTPSAPALPCHPRSRLGCPDFCLSEPRTCLRAASQRNLGRLPGRRHSLHPHTGSHRQSQDRGPDQGALPARPAPRAHTPLQHQAVHRLAVPRRQAQGLLQHLQLLPQALGEEEDV